MGKQAQRIFLVVVDVRVREGLAARAVVGAVQEGRLVREAPFAEVAAELQADVAVRGETRRIAALYPFHVVRGLKTLESYRRLELAEQDRKSTRLNSSHSQISYAVFCLKK